MNNEDDKENEQKIGGSEKEISMNKEDLEESIAKLKIGKASDGDKIVPKILKYLNYRNGLGWPDKQEIFQNSRKKI